LLTLTIWPFYKLKSEKIISIKLGNHKLFKRIVYLFFICFLLILFTSYETIQIVLRGDFAELRSILYKGGSISELSPIQSFFNPVLIIANILGGSSIIMLLFYFYSISFLNNSKLFNTILLLSSTTIVLIGILGVDRSKPIYWIISYGFVITLFWRYFTKERKKKIIRTSILIISVLGIYVLAITISRFGDRVAGTEGGIISYAGQSFINFCFFYDNVDFKEFSLQRILPLFYKLFVENGIEGSGELNAYIKLKTGIRTSVFSTYIGDILVASGKAVTISFCLFISLISNKYVNRINNNTNNTINFYQVIVLFCLSSIPLLGLFTHFYANSPRVIAFWLFIFLAFMFKNINYKNQT